MPRGRVPPGGLPEDSFGSLPGNACGALSRAPTRVRGPLRDLPRGPPRGRDLPRGMPPPKARGPLRGRSPPGGLPGDSFGSLSGNPPRAPLKGRGPPGGLPRNALSRGGAPRCPRGAARRAPWS
ncbi:hypothetical protein Shyhy02_09640 [Streptomyces hygroscopicus subsp. hygroscopicus]|nr:hypothetical protein Shyhy02_09640 [Streptomyces hygroscopicus subsp. hygroscopicus]